MTDNVKPVPDGYHTVTPYLIVPDVDALLAFVSEAFGGRTRARHADGAGRVMHAETTIGDSVIMLGDANEEFPALRSMIHLYVEDVDAAFEQAVRAGGDPLREPEDMPYGDRSAGVTDPWGNRWWIATRVREVEEGA